MTMDEPSSVSRSFTPSASACSTVSCSLMSRETMMSWPLTAGVSSFTPPGMGNALLAALGGVGARRAGEDVVVLQLEAGDALAVDVAVADDLAADGAVGVLAAGVGDEVDAVELEFFDLIGHIDVGLALDVDEGGGRGGQKLAVVGRISPEHRGQRRRLGRRIGHLHGVRVDGGGLHARWPAPMPLRS